MDQEIKEAALNTEEKCISRKRPRENTGSQTDEDCVSGHCCDASASITKLEAKIDKLLDLVTESPFSRGRRRKQTTKEGRGVHGKGTNRSENLCSKHVLSNSEWH